MQTTNAETWNEFYSWFDQLKLERTRLAESTGMPVPKLLFRGQSDASWPQATTTERHYPSALDAKQYYLAACCAKPQIEARTGKQWHLPEPPEYDS